MRRILLTTLLLTALPAAAQAQGFDDGWISPSASEEEQAQSFNGSFWGFGARIGSTSVADSTFEGVSVDVGPRLAFPMYLGDLRLAYRHDALSDGLTVHSVGPTLAVHPLYLVLLGNGWLWYTIASLYGELGVDLQVNTLGEASDRAFAWHWGVGIDVPVWTPDAFGHALWVNLLYRNMRGSLELPGIERDLSQRTFFIGLEWRVNALPF